MAGNSTRARRVGDQIRRELSQMLARSVADPRVEGVMVSDVELSRDLAHATVFVFCPMGSNQAECLSGLQSASGYLRRQVAREIRLRHVPQLHFKIDDTLDHAAHMDALIARAVPSSASTLETPDGESVDAQESSNSDSHPGDSTS